MARTINTLKEEKEMLMTIIRAEVDDKVTTELMLVGSVKMDSLLPVSKDLFSSFSSNLVEDDRTLTIGNHSEKHGDITIRAIVDTVEPGIYLTDDIKGLEDFSERYKRLIRMFA